MNVTLLFPARFSEAEPVGSSAVAPEGGAVIGAALAMPRPLLSAALLISWVVCGVAIALAVARRGHAPGPLVAVGILLGPLLAGYVAVTMSDHEEQVGPLEVAPGVRGGGTVDVLVAVLDDPARVADALPHLRSLGPRLGRVVLARPVTFEAADEDDELATQARADAASALEEAANLLPGIEPQLVLVPGRPRRCLPQFVADHGIEQLVLVGEMRSQAALQAEAFLPEGAGVVTTGEGPQPRRDDG